MKWSRFAGATLALVTVLSVLAVAAMPVEAQSGGRKAAEEALRKGIEAQSKRRHDVAIRLISEAVSSGALARRELARALYRRAVSHRAEKQPAQAISDLNSALFFKDDLTPGDRADAIEQRLKAYRDAGLEAPQLSTTTARAPSSAAIQAPGGPVASGPRVINTAPPRVSEPVRPVTPRPSRSTWSPTAPILGPATEATAVARESAPAAGAATAARAPLTPFQTQTRRGAPAATETPTPPAFTTTTTSRPAAPPAANWSTATVPRAATTSSAAAQAPGATAFAAAPQRTAGLTAPRTADPTAWSSTARPEPDLRQSRNAEAGGVPGRPAPAPAAASRPSEPPAERVAAAPSATPSGGAPAAGGGIGGFFSNLFGGGGGAASLPTASLPTATGAVRPPQAPADRAGEVQTVAAAPAAAAAARPARRLATGYDIEIAVLHDRYRAEAIAKRIMVEYSTDFLWSGRKTRVDERPGAGVEGASLFAVRLGAYDDEAQARAFCGKLASGGHACDVVARE